MPGDDAFVPAFANSSSVGPQGFLDGADKEVDPQRKQDDHADGREDGPESRAGQVGEEIGAPEPLLEITAASANWRFVGRAPPMSPL